MRKFLLYSSALAVFGLSSSVAEAACIQTPSCSSLGYSSSSSCSGGTKCPFGNAWNCTASEIKTELTNKITELEKIIEEIKQNSSSNSDILSNCQVGDILYSDMTIDPDYVSGKTPIGVVFDCRKGLAIGREEALKYWSMKYFDVPGLDNIANSTMALQDIDGKKNTSVASAYCQSNGKSCPAFEYVNSYKTEGTQAGDWYLPAMGELNIIYGNKDILNTALGKIGGTKLISNYYWSSSEKSGNIAWCLRFSNGNVSSSYKEGTNAGNIFYARPVINFGDVADEDSSLSCSVGDIFYSDMTCNANMVASKTPIGVVFDATNRLIIGLEEAYEYWSPSDFDVPEVDNITSSSSVIADWQGKNNTKTILEYCSANGYSCPAFEYVNSYKTSGTNAGDWYLPAMGELNAIYNNKDVLNIALGKIGGTKLGANYYWSSSETSYSDSAWEFYFGNGGMYNDYKSNNAYVRPVMQY